MDFGSPAPQVRTILQETLGYLNFSSGTPDARFLRNVNDLSVWIEGLRTSHQGVSGPLAEEPTWRLLGRAMREYLPHCRGTSDAFRDIGQAEAVVTLVFDHVLGAYRRWHRDLLFHQSDEALFQPFFVGRVCEAVLAEGGPWHENDRIVAGALARLNDFIGHRPVAVLRTQQRIQPYAHERVRPIPLYVAGAGVAAGPCHDLIDRALTILAATDPDLLDEAWFNLDLLDELAVDPRAYDFDHPVNRRPNYQFGQWDPHHLDRQGRFRRFVVQQVTLNTMLQRVAEARPAARDEMLAEAAAVLAGTVLMGSGISGDRPEAHDSSVTLVNLLPRIAAYRDRFYEQLLQRMEGKHGRRLRAEAEKLKQPLGGARQHLNRELARRRACQLQHVHLAQIFARMGYTDAAVRQAQVIPGASARMRCELNCLLATGHLAAERGLVDQAAAVLPSIEDLLHRAIECGALVDPWNILGFGGQFSLFPAVENSVHDHRVDELIELVGRIFGLAATVEKEAAASGRADLQQSTSAWLETLAVWWDQFASTEVSDVSGISGRETWESAAHVAQALRAWHEAGTAAGDVAFWRGHSEAFYSPKAYALVVEALLEQGDLVAAMALLVQWVSQAEEISLVEEGYSFHRLALRWMHAVAQPDDRGEAGAGPQSPGVAPEDRWPRARKFLDFIEANAGPYGEVPELEIGDLHAAAVAGQGDEEDDEDGGGLFGAAYEGVTYRDTTDDGIEGEMVEWGHPATDFELATEGERILHRLAFWNTMSRLWKLAAAVPSPGADAGGRDEALAAWFAQAAENQRRLRRLLLQVHRYAIPAPRSAHEAMLEYERRREIKDNLLERVIASCVETADAGWMLLARTAGGLPDADLADWEGPAVAVLRAVTRGDAEAARAAWPKLAVALLTEPLLYVPTSRGGHPEKILASQKLHRLLRRLLICLPRLGLLDQTFELVALAREMERQHPVGPGAITEFDRLFDAGFRAMVRCVVDSSASWTGPKARKLPPAEADDRLVACLDSLTRPLLQWWLEHSRAIRLSPLEAVGDDKKFDEVRRFIQRFGAEWFTQQFMNYGNLRAILLQGVEAYLGSLEEDEDPQFDPQRQLLRELTDPDARQGAIRCLELVLDAVVEHYSEYMDYNSTTTQSDRGEMLYTLLDFLRVLAGHERVEWNLKPLAAAHEVLIRAGRAAAAEMWRDAVVEQTSEIADAHLKRFDRLSRQYGMRLASIADRLAERFVRPLAVDRLRALVRPAIEEVRAGKAPEAFAQLEEETSQMADEPSGVGLEVPEWLEALEDEVDEVQSPAAEMDDPLGPDLAPPQVRLTQDEIQRQLERWM